MGVKPGAGGVVRVGNKNHPGAVGHGLGHGRQIVAEQIGRHLHRRGVTSQGHNRVHRKSVFGENRFVAFLQVGPGNQIQHIVGTVTQRQLRALHTQFFRQGRFQGKRGAIRIQMQLVKMLEGMKSLVAGAQRILVTGQFDDIGDAQLTLQLLDGLARLVGLELLDTVVGEFDVVHIRSANASGWPAARNTLETECLRTAATSNLVFHLPENLTPIRPLRHIKHGVRHGA